MTAPLVVSRSLEVRDRVAAAIVGALVDAHGVAALRDLVRAGDWPVDEVAVVLRRLDVGLRAATNYRSAPPPSGADTLTRALVQSSHLFAAGLFFEVHEVLEAEWIELGDPERSAVQGLIQIAVGLHHLGHDNPRGAGSLFAAGRAKLLPHRPSYLGVDVDALLDGLVPWEAAAAAGVWPRDVALPPMRVVT